MSDPTVIELEETETEQIITEQDAQRGIPYLVEVRDNPIRFAHQEMNADRGAELSSGQTHTLSNLRGEPIFITPQNGSASVRVRPAGADVRTQPTREVNIDGDVNTTIDSEVDIEDRAAREIGKIRVQSSNGTLIDPATSDDLEANQPRTVTNTVTIQEDQPIQIDGEVTADSVSIEDTAPVSDSTADAGEANAAVLDTNTRTSVDIFVSVSGPAVITVETSTDGATWRERMVVEKDTADTDTVLIDTGYQHVRAYADQNVNVIEIASKGV